MSDDEIRLFFAEYIRGFMFSDVRAVIAAKANFGAALMLLSYTEVLGGLSTGDLGLDGKSRANFEAGLRSMVWNGDAAYYSGFSVWLEESGTKKEASAYKIFRCGVVHEYFAKGLVLIHNNPDGLCIPADQGFGWVDEAGVPRLRLHTNAYLRDFEQAFNSLESRVLVVGSERGSFEQAVQRLRGRRVEKK